jgi:hypothetical protein
MRLTQWAWRRWANGSGAAFLRRIGERATTLFFILIREERGVPAVPLALVGIVP